MTERKGDWIQTYKGRQFWPMDPRPEDVNILDIAHSLSHLCRYTGHCIRFYSVAEHSVLMSRYVKTNKLWALLHDATEAYLVDVPRPIKPFLIGYKQAELAIQRVIATRFNLPPDIPAEVHDADRRILTDEMQQNMAPPPEPWSTVAEPLGVALKFWTPERAEYEFLEEFCALSFANDNRPKVTNAA